MLLLLVVAVLVTWVAGVEGDQRANVDVLLHETNTNGGLQSHEYRFLGSFSTSAVAASAEGPVVQVHPMGLCTDGDFEEGIGEQSNYGWVVLIKLEVPQLDPDPCMSIYYKAKRSIHRGATAVIFDISNNLNAAQQLRRSKEPKLERPVILVQGKEALQLMEAIGSQSSAHARINPMTARSAETSTTEYFIMGVFVVFFILCCCICLTVILKLKQKYMTRHMSPSQMAKRALAKLKTRRFKATEVSKSPSRMSRSLSMTSDLYSCGSNGELCAICLDQYDDAQVLRILPCCHEFHKGCVDPWLIKNHTCPLCLYDIVDPTPHKEKASCSRLESGGERSNNNLSQWRLLASSRRLSNQQQQQQQQAPSVATSSPLRSPFHSAASRSRSAASPSRTASTGLPSQLFTRLDTSQYHTSPLHLPPGWVYERPTTSSTNPTVLCNYDLAGAQTYTSMAPPAAKPLHFSPYSNLKSARSKGLSRNGGFRRRPRTNWYYGTSSESEVEHTPPGQNLLRVPAADRSDTTSPDSDNSNRNSAEFNSSNNNTIPQNYDAMRCSAENCITRPVYSCVAGSTGNTVILSCNCNSITSQRVIPSTECQCGPKAVNNDIFMPGDRSSKDSDNCTCAQSIPNTDCSNQSTFGSSELPSDISSQDYEIYHSSSPFEQTLGIGDGQTLYKDSHSNSLSGTRLQPACLRDAVKPPYVKFIYPGSAVRTVQPDLNQRRPVSNYGYQALPDCDSVLLDYDYTTGHEGSDDLDQHSSCFYSQVPSECQSTLSRQPLLQSQNSVYLQSPCKTTAESLGSYVPTVDTPLLFQDHNDNPSPAAQRDLSRYRHGVSEGQCCEDTLLNTSNAEHRGDHIGGGSHLEHVVQLHREACLSSARSSLSSNSSGLSCRDQSSIENNNNCAVCTALKPQNRHVPSESYAANQNNGTMDVDHANPSTSNSVSRAEIAQKTLFDLKSTTTNSSMTISPKHAASTCQYESHSPWVLQSSMENKKGAE